MENKPVYIGHTVYDSIESGNGILTQPTFQMSSCVTAAIMRFHFFPLSPNGSLLSWGLAYYC